MKPSELPVAVTSAECSRRDEEEEEVRKQSESIDCGWPGKQSTLSPQPRFWSKIDKTPSWVPTTAFVFLFHPYQFDPLSEI